jgi:hypothetical protein
MRYPPSSKVGHFNLQSTNPLGRNRTKNRQGQKKLALLGTASESQMESAFDRKIRVVGRKGV